MQHRTRATRSSAFLAELCVFFAVVCFTRSVVAAVTTTVVVSVTMMVAFVYVLLGWEAGLVEALAIVVPLGSHFEFITLEI